MEVLVEVLSSTRSPSRELIISLLIYLMCWGFF